MKTNPLAAAGVVAGPLFLAAATVEAATRPDYRTLRHPISSLALGPGGWTQSVLFVVAGVLCVLLTIALARTPGAGTRWGVFWLGLWSVSLVGVGLFVTDAVSGYPAGTPDYPVGTLSGALHNVFALLGAIGLVGSFVTWRRRGGAAWKAYSMVTLLIFVLTFLPAAAGLGQAAGLVEIAGGLERVAVYAAWAWITVLAWKLYGGRLALSQASRVLDLPGTRF
ncbi:DUF998 domain-containing protein [Hamadaea tsunoensis]|uniref:DUF998 domain-containing protein n=1 Tax=Hamadaea tsunoensis TaxID=53368 RepID=UPI0004299E49|nr:DUF998 domain-containing protein [Hamadaea tsunoensis]